jgi:hypothetical protein
VNVKRNISIRALNIGDEISFVSRFQRIFDILQPKKVNILSNKDKERCCYFVEIIDESSILTNMSNKVANISFF